jgi:hypothetical protein
MIQLRGGLNKIRLPGLAAVISYSDIIAASRSLSRPHYPFARLDNDLQLPSRDISWNDHDPLLNVEMTPEMYLTFQDARAYMSLVERFIDGIEISPNSATILCDSRNSVQWHIMSLRISLIIFSVGVIFPLQPQSAPLQKLVKLLQLELQSCAGSSRELSSSSSSSTGFDIHLWCFFMGGIAATGTQERTWFVDELRRVYEHDAVSTWDEVRVILKSVLWLDSACDSAGKDLWNEIRRPIV